MEPVLVFKFKFGDEKAVDKFFHERLMHKKFKVYLFDSGLKKFKVEFFDFCCEFIESFTLLITEFSSKLEKCHS